MQKRKTATKKRPQRSGGDQSKRSSTYLALLGCAVVLVSGFFFAGRHHFASMDYGIKNSRLRKQIDELKAEKQRLLFTRELSLSPNEIKRSAERAGILGTRQDEAMTPSLASVTRDKKKAPAASAAEPAIIKTALVQPTAPRPQKAVERVNRSDKRTKSLATE